MSDWKEYDQQSLFDQQPQPEPQPEHLIEDPAEGTRLKKEGMSKAERAARVQLWKDDADAWFRTVGWGSIVTSDDLVAACGTPDIGSNRNNVIGAWWSARARARDVEWTGEMVRSRRKVRHVNLIRVWRKT